MSIEVTREALEWLVGALSGHATAPAPAGATPGDPEPTVAQLLLHRAGLAKSLGRRPPPGRASLGEAAPEIALAWPPGARAEYSNTGYLLLGELIQTVAGEPFAEFCSREAWPGSAFQAPAGGRPAR